MLKHFNLAAVAWSCLACYWFWAYDKTGNLEYASVMTVIGLISSLGGALGGFAYDRLSERIFIGYQIWRLERKRTRGEMTTDFYEVLGWAHGMRKDYQQLVEVFEEARSNGMLTQYSYRLLAMALIHLGQTEQLDDLIQEARNREIELDIDRWYQETGRVAI